MAQSPALGFVVQLQGMGFTKVCVISKGYAILGASSNNDVPAVWDLTTTQEDQTTKTVQVNENQELVNNWAKAMNFKFWKKKFSCVKEGAKDRIIGKKGSNGAALMEKDNMYIAVECALKGMMSKTKAKNAMSFQDLTSNVNTFLDGAEGGYSAADDDDDGDDE